MWSCYFKRGFHSNALKIIGIMISNNRSGKYNNHVHQAETSFLPTIFSSLINRLFHLHKIHWFQRPFFCQQHFWHHINSNIQFKAKIKKKKKIDNSSTSAVQNLSVFSTSEELGSHKGILEAKCQRNFKNLSWAFDNLFSRFFSLTFWLHNLKIELG